jgi:uncharacterized Zn finger protein
MSRYYNDYPEYESVGKKQEKAKKLLAKLRKKGTSVNPVDIQGRRNIVTTFWGKSWCQHLESYSDYSNRLPRGRSYIRHGAVVHLELTAGRIEAKVSGSHGSVYCIKGKIDPLAEERWKKLKKECSGKIGSLMELLEGKLDGAVMEHVIARDTGLFPSPAEISLECDCPDWAGLCKHNAAVLYGIGVRFDEDPTLLFKLRGLDHEELLDSADVLDSLGLGGESDHIEDDSLADIFGIDIEPGDVEPPTPPPDQKKKKKAPAKKARRKK